MKFFSKHKKKVLALCLSAVLLSCFMGFSISSSAAEVVTTELHISGIYFQYISGGTNFLRNPSDGFYIFDRDLGYSTPTPLFSQLAFYSAQTGGLYTVPDVDGRGVSLSVNLSFLLTATGYLSITPSEDILSGAIFTDCMINVYFSDGTSVYHRPYDSFVLKDDLDGQVINPNSVEYWQSIAGSPANLDIWALFDLSDSMGKTINSIYILFPSSHTEIYYSNIGLDDYFAITDPSLSIDFHYTPFNNVVVEDLTDIKGSLSGVSNKLDSISSSMNTIDEDINRVNQTVSDLKDSFDNFQDDLTTPNTDISNSNSELQDKITDVQDQISSLDKEVNNAVDNVLDNVPGAENPFVGPDVPVLGDIWAKQFIDELWGFIKSYSILFTFIHTGLLFCLASFILRR